MAHLWRQEQQNRNAQEIARQCASLYDKFVGFVEDLDKVGQRLEQAQTDAAIKPATRAAAKKPAERRGRK